MISYITTTIKILSIITRPFPYICLKMSVVVPSLSVASLDAFWSMQDAGKKRETQLQRYESAGAPEAILRIIRIGGGPGMGVALENIARHGFAGTLLKRAKGKEETGYDHRVIVSSPSGEKTVNIEQKSSGLWGIEENSFRWQHLEIDHKWDMLLLAGIQTTGVDFWGMSRANFIKAIEEGKATNQGNKKKESSEGVWMEYKNVKEYTIPIRSTEELAAFAAAL